MADLLPLPLEQLDAFLEYGEVLWADVARERLPEQAQVGQVIGPARKPALQLLRHRVEHTWFVEDF